MLRKFGKRSNHTSPPSSIRLWVHVFLMWPTWWQIEHVICMPFLDRLGLVRCLSLLSFLLFCLGRPGYLLTGGGEYVAHFNFSPQILPIQWGDTVAVSTFVQIFLEIIGDEIGRILPNPVNAGNDMGARNASYIKISASTGSIIQVHHKSVSRQCHFEFIITRMRNIASPRLHLVRFKQQSYTRTYFIMSIRKQLTFLNNSLHDCSFDIFQHVNDRSRPSTEDVVVEAFANVIIDDLTFRPFMNVSPSKFR